MFFILSKLLFFLINPLTWVMTGLLLGIFSRKPKIRKVSIILATSLLLVFSNPLLVNYVLKKWEHGAVRPDELPLVRTGVMLGGITETNKEVSEQLHLNDNVDRLTESLRLLREGIIQELIISGGSGSLHHPEGREAEDLAGYLKTLGFGANEIMIESESRNTHENAIETAKILEERHVKDRPILLITSAFHMHRSLRCFEKQGITVLPYPVDYKASTPEWNPAWILPGVDALNSWLILFKEWAGLAAYKVMGYA